MRKALVILISATAMVSWSCERENSSMVEFSLSQPFVISAALATQHLNLDDTTTGFVTKLPDGSYTISDSLTAIIITPGGHNGLVVYYRLVNPLSAEAYPLHALEKNIASGIGSSSDDTLVYAQRFSFSVDSSTIGTYRIEVFAKNRLNSLSNSLFLPLVVTVNNRSPQITPPSLRVYTPSGSDSALFTFSMSVNDPDGIEDISSVVLQPLFASDTTTKHLYDDGLPEHSDRISGDGIFSAKFWVDTASLASIEFRLFAVDRSGSRSNVVLQTLRNHAPEIANVVVPDSIRRPSSGSQAINFFVSVTDADGLSDIDSVYFRNFSSVNPTNRFLMYDDGDSTHGDATAHDGTYSLIVSINSTTSLGIKEFHFYVVDKAGAKDERIKFITIYP